MASDEVPSDEVPVKPQKSSSMLAMCCCVEEQPRETLPQWMLLNTNASAQPSLMQRLLCQCGPEARVSNGIEDIPEIRGVAGGLLQSAPPDWPTKGSVQTLKYCKFDKEKRVATIQVFGGFGGPSSVGLWTEPGGSCKWYFLINLARCCNYSYRFEFSEDWRHADIKIMANFCCVCCVPPCFPACCALPDCLVKVRPGDRLQQRARRCPMLRTPRVTANRVALLRAIGSSMPCRMMTQRMVRIGTATAHNAAASGRSRTISSRLTHPMASPASITTTWLAWRPSS